MPPVALVAVGAFALLFALVSKRVETSDVSPTMLFTGAGLLAGPAVMGWIQVESSVLHLVGEWTLILLLFTDASRIRLAALRRNAALPLRLLGIGMPLTIVTGTALGLLLLPELSLWEACLLATVLAPTDAALGQAVVSAPAVPQRIRQALNVESGLNDGIALPFVMVFAALAGPATEQSAGSWIGFSAQQVGVGVLAGVAAGVGGGALLRWCDGRAQISPSFERVGALAVAGLAVGAAELGGGNAFIAAFVAGISLGNTAPAYSVCVHEFLEAEGQLLMLVVFMLVGAGLAWPAMEAATAGGVLYALGSLTVVRMLPVAVSLMGTGGRPATTVFLGWFGPRGLATVLFGLLIVHDTGVPHGEFLFQVAICTVVLSIVLHGVTANRGAEAYGRVMAVETDAMEHREVEAMPVRAPGWGA